VSTTLICLGVIPFFASRKAAKPQRDSWVPLKLADFAVRFASVSVSP
jgi:hypothetical protein